MILGKLATEELLIALSRDEESRVRLLAGQFASLSAMSSDFLQKQITSLKDSFKRVQDMRV